MPEKKKRLANIDLIRIVSIFIIILHHYAIHGGWHFDAGVSVLRTTVEMLALGGKVGVNMYVMITGFFLIQRTSKFSSILKIMVHTTFISLLMFVVVLMSGIVDQFTWQMFITHLFPVFFNEYWFVTTFVLMSLFIPVINPYLNSLSQSKYLKVLLWGGLILSIWPMVYNELGMTYTRVGWFLYVYAWGGFFGKYYANKSQLDNAGWSVSKLASVLASALVFALLSNVTLQWLTQHTVFGVNALVDFVKWNSSTWLTANYSPLVLILSLVIFALFLHIRLPENKVISYVGQATFTVYLVQSATYFAGWLWLTVDAKRFTQPLEIVGYGVGVVSVLFLVGMIVHTLLDKPSSWLTQQILKLGRKSA